MTSAIGSGSAILRGKVACVTGVSGGLGRAIVTEFARAGARVVGVARRVELGRELEAEVTANGGEMVFVAADLRHVVDCQQFISTAVDRFGAVDILVNNAAVRPEPPLLAIHETDEANWDHVFDVNLKGPFFCTKFALSAMRAAQRGLVLNIASYTAIEATAGMALYCSSKAALVQLTRGIAVEYGVDGIRANAIILGGTGTGQAQRTMAAQDRFLEQRPWATGGVSARPRADLPKRRSGMAPDAVARLLAFLSTDDAALINGASIAVDGAVSAGLHSSNWTHLMMQVAAPPDPA
jgi:NAD(P)-dependent dehydrogenase (short-subunit alcohol dehydrogenase family)